MSRVSARGPHGLGKSALAAIATHWYALTRDGHDWKVATTASVWAQLIQYLWPEIHKWSRYIKWEKIGRPPYDVNKELFTLKLQLSTGQAYAIASDDPQRIEGAHADYMFYIFDESKIVPDPTWDSAEGALSTGREKFWLAVSTPGEPIGRFHDIQTKQPGYEDWWVRHVSLKESVDSGRIDAEWAEQRKLQWGAKSIMYLNRVEGEFASSGEETVIPAEWIDAAIERGRDHWKELDYHGAGPQPMDNVVTHIGVDVARKGGDATVFFPRFGHICFPPVVRGSQDTMVTTGDLVQLLHKWRNAVAVIDVIGVGAGVYDRAREVIQNDSWFRDTKRTGYRDSAQQLGSTVIYKAQDVIVYSDIIFPFISSGHTKWMDRSMNLKFRDVRSAAWWNMRELLDPAYGSDIVLPDIRELRAELASPGYEALSDGRIKVEPKDEIYKRLGRSTNHADSLIMSFWSEAYNTGMEFA